MRLIPGEHLSQRRKLLGFTQVQLATKANISLPTLQNIEADKANPSLEILTKLLGALGYQIRIEESPPDWTTLTYIGLPLAAGVPPRAISPDEAKLELRKAIAYLVTSTDTRREDDALIAFLAALRDHYPSVFRKFSSQSTKVVLEEKIKKMNLGRFIRLRKAALGALRKDYLE